MGNWNIHIDGIGPHDNGIPEDADQIAAEMVKRLKAAGHTVHRANFTVVSKSGKSLLSAAAPAKVEPTPDQPTPAPTAVNKKKGN